MSSTQTPDTRHLQGSGELANALRLSGAPIQADCRNADMYYELGLLQRESGKIDEAIRSFKNAVTLGDSVALAEVDLAACLILKNRPAEAELHARSALNKNADLLDGQRQLLNALFLQGNYSGAHPIAKRLLCHVGADLEDRLLAARVFACADDYAEAIAVIKSVIDSEPDAREAYLLLSQFLQESGQCDSALLVAEQAQALAPEDMSISAARAHLLEQQGDYEAAYRMIEPLVKNETVLCANVIHIFARLAKRFGETDVAIELLNQLLENETHSINVRMTTLKLLASIHDACGNYEKAFVAVEQANNLLPDSRNEKHDVTLVSSVLDWFSAARVDAMNPIRESRLAELGQSQEGEKVQPIFLVGLPHSGVGLVERILHQTSQVHVAGRPSCLDAICGDELPVMLCVADDFPVNLRALNKEVASATAQLYVQQLTDAVPNSAKRVVDSSFENHLLLGLISTLFPHAKIVYCSRDLMAAGLASFFGNDVVEGQREFTGSLEQFGRYAIRHQQLMRHWQSVLPSAIHEFNYERFMSESNQEVECLLEFCELSDDLAQSNCTGLLHSTNAFDSSLGMSSTSHWRHYERQLQPLKQALGTQESEAA